MSVKEAALAGNITAHLRHRAELQTHIDGAVLLRDGDRDTYYFVLQQWRYVRVDVSPEEYERGRYAYGEILQRMDEELEKKS